MENAQLSSVVQQCSSVAASSKEGDIDILRSRKKNKRTTGKKKTGKTVDSSAPTGRAHARGLFREADGFGVCSSINASQRSRHIHVVYRDSTFEFVLQYRLAIGKKKTGTNKTRKAVYSRWV